MATDPRFGDALRAAIQRRDLTLDRLRSRLRERGIDISVSTLSYWQQGRSRPERPNSLLALRELECVLGLTPAALSDLLEAPRPRGRQVTPDVDVLVTLYGTDSPLLPLLDGSFDNLNRELTTVHLTDVCTIGPDRSLRRIASTQVVRALAPGQDRIRVVYGADRGHPVPVDVQVSTGRLGEVRVDHANGVMVAEILFGTSLGKNDTAVVEYDTILPASGAVSADHEHRFRTPVAGYLHRVRFSPRARPLRCHAFQRTPTGVTRNRLVLDPFDSVHTFVPRCVPGAYGISWCWT